MSDSAHWGLPLPQVLVLEQSGVDRFAARLDGFGGITLGCAALAAGLTTDRPLHALHAWFLRPPPLDRPVEIGVERVRDGRRLAQRRATVRSGETLLCELLASYATPAPGLDAQDVKLDPSVPAPETLESEAQIAQREGWTVGGPGPLGGPLEWRWVGGTPWSSTSACEDSRYGAWVRPRFPLPEQRAWHAAALAYLADYHSHMSVARWLGGIGEPVGFVSLDQSLWIHRDLIWNDWWHIATEGVVAHAGRALTRRSLHTREGRLVATMAQEQLIPAPR